MTYYLGYNIFMFDMFHFKESSHMVKEAFLSTIEETLIWIDWFVGTSISSKKALKTKSF